MENGFILLFGLSMLYFATTSRISSHIKLLITQGVLLFLIYIFGHKEHTVLLEFIFLTVETLGVKAIVIPWFLHNVMKKTHSDNRDMAAHIPHFYCLVVASVVLLIGLLSSHYFFASAKMISSIYFGVSISTIIISLWLMTIKHSIISNVIAFITMENGIFLLSLAVQKQMPVLVNLGVLLDVFIAVFILGLFVNEIDKKFQDLEVSHLSELKDNE